MARRVVDPKEQVRALVALVLSTRPRQYGAELVLAGAGRALVANKAPRVKCAVLEYLAGVVAGLDTAQQQRGVPDDGGGALVPVLRSMMHHAGDKSQDIRRAAARALAAIHWAGQQASLLAALHTLPPAELLAAQRALAPVIPGLDAAIGSARQHSRACGHTSVRQHEGCRSSEVAEVAAPCSVLPSCAPAAGQHSPPPSWQPAAEVMAAEQHEELQQASGGADGDGAQHPSAQLLGPAAAAAAHQCDNGVDAAATCADDGGEGEEEEGMEAQLRKLLAQLQGGCAASEVLHSLAHLARTLPGAAWPAYFWQVSGV